MLARGVELIVEARSRGHAIPAITTYSLESTRATCAAAEATGLPVILQAGSSSFGAVGRRPLAAAAIAEAHYAGVNVGVHLDHSTDLNEIRACIELGYTSVMIDGSGLSFEDNVRLTRAAVELGRAAGVWVEGELGALPGDEDASSNAAAGEMTDPEKAAEFAERTGVDALAVAIGNVHGISETPVRLDLDRLAAIAAATDTPLVLHGASGLPNSDLTGAVALGVCKVNVNAEVRRAQVSALAEGLASCGDDVRALQIRVIDAMQAVVEDKLRVLAGEAV